MPEVYLASAALAKDPKKFDSFRTLEEAARGFAGAQIYLDARFNDERYRREFIEEAKKVHAKPTRLGLLVHLPNLPSDKDLRITEEIVAGVPKTKVLVHFEPLQLVPEVRGARVGFENTVNYFDYSHLVTVYTATRKQRRPFVFDYGRSFSLSDQYDERQKKHWESRIISTTKALIHLLKPKRDIIHAADKRDWSSHFRDAMCVLGEGVSAPILPDLKAYPGIVVLELEDLQMARESLAVLKES